MLHNAHQPSYWPIDFDTIYQEMPAGPGLTQEQILELCVKQTDLISDARNAAIDEMASDLMARFAETVAKL